MSATVASITKRGKFWRAQVVRRGDPPQYRTFDVRAEAEAWARTLETEMNRGIFVSRAEAERTTLAESLERYKAEISAHKAHPQQDDQRIGHWLMQELANDFLANLRGADFARYRDQRIAMGLPANRAGRPGRALPGASRPGWTQGAATQGGRPSRPSHPRPG